MACLAADRDRIIPEESHQEPENDLLRRCLHSLEVMKR